MISHLDLPVPVSMQSAGLLSALFFPRILTRAHWELGARCSIPASYVFFFLSLLTTLPLQ